MAKRVRNENASLTRRCASYFIDWYVGALCAALPISIVSQKLYGTMTKQNILEIAKPYGLIAGIIGVIIALFYYIYVPTYVYKGQTFGKHLCHIKMIQEDGSDVTLKSMILRQGLGMIVLEGILASASTLWHQIFTLCTGINIVSVMMYAGFVVGGISVLLLVFTKDHRALHDRIGKTIVVMDK